MVGCVVMLVVTSVKLTLLALACMPVVLLPIGLLGVRVRRLSRAVQDRVADVTSHVDETLHEIRTVQAYAHEAPEVRTFGERVEAVFAAAVQRSGYLALLIAAVIVLAFGAVGLLLWVGAHDVFAGRLSGGRAHGVHLLRGDRRQRDVRAGRGVRRDPARRGRLRAPARAARDRAAHPGAPAAPGARWPSPAQGRSPSRT